MTSILTLAIICATIVLCMRQRGKTRIRLAEIAANASPIVLHADATTGEIREPDGGHLPDAESDPEDDPQMGTNQRGVWALPA